VFDECGLVGVDRRRTDREKNRRISEYNSKIMSEYSQTSKKRRDKSINKNVKQSSFERSKNEKINCLKSYVRTRLRGLSRECSVADDISVRVTAGLNRLENVLREGVKSETGETTRLCSVDTSTLGKTYKCSK
jgi:hypothetical protein